MTRLTDLEARYPDIPPQVLLKADLAFTGIRVTRALVDAGVGSVPHFRRVQCDGQLRVIPYFLRIPDGAEGGGELLVLVRPDQSSPYRMEGAPGDYRLFEDDSFVCAIRPAQMPGWHVWAAKEGLTRAMTGLSQHGDMLVANLAPACEYWAAPGEGAGHKCLFCGYGAVSERSEHLNQRRDIASVAPETLGEFSRVLGRSRADTKHLYLVGGSMRDIDKEGQRYLELTRAAVKSEPSYRGFIGCGSQALPKAWSMKIKAAGAGYACFNLEVWDAGLWAKICPGKAGFIGRDLWLENMLDAVDVFGRGAVLSAFVAGAELVPPLGLSTVEQALESNVAGADWLLKRGIVSIYSPLSPSLSSEYGKAAGPTLDYFIRLNRETARLRREHNMPIDTRYVCSGCTYAQIECDLDRLA